MATKGNTNLEPTRVLHARIPSDLMRDFERIAVRHDRTVSQEVRQLMRQHIDANRDDATVEAA